MNIASWIGLAGSALLIGTAAAAVASTLRKSSTARFSITTLAFVLAFVPIHGLPIAAYVRGSIGDISVTTWILLAAVLVSNLTERKISDARSRSVLVRLVLLSGLVLYPSALGATYFDVYTLGYGPKLLWGSFFFLSLLTWYLGYHLVTWCLTASILAYSLQIFESRNLWDYWIDPLVTIYALQHSLRSVVQLALGKKRAPRGSTA
jgi:hypothetical protein